MASSKKSYWKGLIDAITAKPNIPEKTADFSQNQGGTSRTLFNISFDGEKNFGEAGPIRQYILDYVGLRMRSYQSYLDSEITQTVINRFTTWVVGKGLKLQAEPSEPVLKTEGINIDTQEFCQTVEARFNLFRKSKASDFQNMKSINRIAKRAFKNAILGGDVLVVLRYDKTVTVQLIDGAHVQSPTFGSESFPQELGNGVQLINGIEINAKGEHIAFWIRNKKQSYDRIAATGAESGLTMAFLVYGLEYRLNNVRGLPLIAAVIETLKKLERYKEAAVGGAEERMKIPYFFEHTRDSTGENPMERSMAKAFDANANTDLPKDINATELANTIASTENKSVYNLPIGATVKGMTSNQDLLFKDFYSVNIDLVCAALGIPPEVAMSKYDSNFSASRAALKDWEHTLNVQRDQFSEEFYQHIYNFWLEIEILKNKVIAPGYLQASISGNDMILEAYRNARFVGASVPHIDPLKEVKAEREKLGDQGTSFPLSTYEAAVENLGGSDSREDLKQFAQELDDLKKLKIKPEPVAPIVVDPTKPPVKKNKAVLKEIMELLTELTDKVDSKN